MPDLSQHPCFSPAARFRHGRIHLPVAPACNVKCNFCDRKYSCVNESRPGVTASIMSPDNALEYLHRIILQRKDISVVGIAGPGDPFANTDATLRTLELVRSSYPEMLLCVATNGLGLYENVDALADLKVSHVTVTVNAVDPSISEKIYAWVYWNNRRLDGTEAAQVLLAGQIAGIQALIRRGIIVKVNTIIIPGINDAHVIDISRTLSLLGVDYQNCIPLLPVEGTDFAHIPEPEPDQIHEIRNAAGEFVTQMSHCTRCRADACGLLNETETMHSQLNA